MIDDVLRKRLLAQLYSKYPQRIITLADLTEARALAKLSEEGVCEFYPLTGATCSVILLEEGLPEACAAFAELELRRIL